MPPIQYDLLPSPINLYSRNSWNMVLITPSAAQRCIRDTICQSATAGRATCRRSRRQGSPHLRWRDSISAQSRDEPAIGMDYSVPIVLQVWS